MAVGPSPPSLHMYSLTVKWCGVFGGREVVGSWHTGQSESFFAVDENDMEGVAQPFVYVRPSQHNLLSSVGMQYGHSCLCVTDYYNFTLRISCQM